MVSQNNLPGSQQNQQQMMSNSNIQGQTYNQGQQHSHNMMASNIQGGQHQAPTNISTGVSALKAQYDQINQPDMNSMATGNINNPQQPVSMALGGINNHQQQQSGSMPIGSLSNQQQPEAMGMNGQPLGPVGISGVYNQQTYPNNSNQTVISPGLNNTPLINNKSGNLVSQQNSAMLGQENIVRPPLDLVNSKVPFPSINELPEAIRLSLQGSIKTLLQMNSPTKATKNKTPTKTTSANKSVTSASPQTIKLNPAI